MQSDHEEGGSFDRVRELFERAMELQPAAREAFVRGAEGYSAAEREEVLGLLRAAGIDTMAVREAADAAQAAEDGTAPTPTLESSPPPAAMPR